MWENKQTRPQDKQREKGIRIMHVGGNCKKKVEHKNRKVQG